MSTLTRGTTPITVIIGRRWSMPISKQNPDGSAQDTTGLDVSAAMIWTAASQLLVPVVSERVDAAGTALLSLETASTALLPPAASPVLRITYTDADGDTDDFELPVTVVRP